MSGAEVDAQFDLRELLRVLWRRKGTIFCCIVLTALAAAVVLSRLTPLYTASADVRLNDEQTNLADDVEAVVSRLTDDVDMSEIVETEIQVVQSRDLAAQTIAELGLDRNPEFNEDLRPPGLLDNLLALETYLPQPWLERLGLGPDEPLLTREAQLERERERVIDAFLERLEVVRQGLSRVLRVSFEAEDPQLAARVANTLTKYYIVSQLDAKLEATRNANDWLVGRLEELRTEVQAAEKAAADFRNEAGLIGSDDAATVSEQQVAELNAALIEAEATRADVQARLDQARNLAASGAGIASAGEVLQSPVIQSLREQESELRREAAELGQQYGERHPLMRNVQAKMADLRANIAAEIGRIVQGLEGEARVATTRVETLRNALSAAEGKLGEMHESEVRMRALEREADANRRLLETFLVRSKETSAQETFQTPDAVVISPAAAPERPSFPKKIPLMALALLAGAGLGVFVAFAREALDPGFRSLDQIEKTTGLMPLGMIPATGGQRHLRRGLAAYVLAHPMSAVAEALRNLYSSLILSNGEQKPKTIMVVSSMPKEGKTSTTVALAYLVAGLGKRVIVVDCDLRQPRTHAMMRLRSAPGLADYIDGSVGLEQIIQHQPDTGVDLIACGQAPKRSLVYALGSSALEDLIDTLSAHYDLVLIDTAPVLATADARILMPLVDKVVFVVRWAHTRRNRAIWGLQKLVADIGYGKLAGVLLTMVDVKKHAQYSYGDSGDYYGAIERYYSR